MVSQSNQWTLFGFDIRTIGQLWGSAWKSFLFSEHTPLRERFDEPVLLRGANREEAFQGGRPVKPASGSQPRFGAILLSDELVLERRLSIPLAAEAELDAVIAMEVASGSPFSPEDTVYGARELSRDQSGVSLLLAISSRAGVRQWLNEQEWIGAAVDTQEVWAEVDGVTVCISGFGEVEREQAYRKRLVRASLIVGSTLLLLLLAASIYAMQQRASLSNLNALQASVTDESETAAYLRETLANANDTISAANEVIVQFPNPHLEISRLTELLEDDVFLAHFSMRGNDLRIRGRATDAAVVMQTLAETNAYESVMAPQAITAVGNTGLEQFHLDINLADESVEPGADE